jgi:hypothetical protein
MMATYYDYVLGFIPLVLLGFGGGLHVAGFSLELALGTAGLLAIGLMGHALFVNAPVEEIPQQSHDPVETTSSVSMSD